MLSPAPLPPIKTPAIRILWKSLVGGGRLAVGVGGGGGVIRVGEESEVSGKWQPSTGVSGGKLLLNGEMKMEE